MMSIPAIAILCAGELCAKCLRRGEVAESGPQGQLWSISMEATHEQELCHCIHVSLPCCIASLEQRLVHSIF